MRITQKDGARSRRTLLIFSQLITTNRMKGSYCPPWCSIRSIVSRLDPRAGKLGGKVTTIYFRVVLSPFLRYASEISKRLFLSSPWPFNNTVDGVPRNVILHQSRLCNGTSSIRERDCTLWFGNCTSNFRAVLILSQHVSTFSSILHSLGTY